MTPQLIVVNPIIVGIKSDDIKQLAMKIITIKLGDNIPITQSYYQLSSFIITNYFGYNNNWQLVRSHNNNDSKDK